VDGYLEEEKCVLEVEAGRWWESNAIHRNLVRTMAIDGADILILAIPNVYKRKRSTRPHFDGRWMSTRLELVVVTQSDDVTDAERLVTKNERNANNAPT
jgi:hypothetical protein